MVTPSALAYQPEGADWADPTFVDFWTGLPLVAISALGLILYSLGLTEELRNRSILRRRSYEDHPQRDVEAQTISPQQGSMEQSLVPLMAAMLQDMQDQRQRREAPDREDAPGGNAHNDYAAHSDQ
jgi:hypothetical protein